MMFDLDVPRDRGDDRVRIGFPRRWWILPSIFLGSILWVKVVGWACDLIVLLARGL